MNRVTPFLALTAACLLLPTPAQAVNKCVDPATGKVTYSDAACPATSKNTAMEWAPPTGGNSVSEPTAGEKRRRAASERAVDMRILAMQHQIAIGMSEDLLVESWGNPTSINTDSYGNGRTSKQWIYRRGNATQYVYTDGAVVTAIQDRPAIVSAPVARCYTELEIRNARTGASSLTLSADERAARRDNIDRMPRCQ